MLLSRTVIVPLLVVTSVITTLSNRGRTSEEGRQKAFASASFESCSGLHTPCALPSLSGGRSPDEACPGSRTGSPLTRAPPSAPSGPGLMGRDPLPLDPPLPSPLPASPSAPPAPLLPLLPAVEEEDDDDDDDVKGFKAGLRFFFRFRLPAGRPALRCSRSAKVDLFLGILSLEPRGRQIGRAHV